LARLSFKAIYRPVQVQGERMGFFITGAAAILVAMQTTLLLIERKPTSWTFSLIRKRMPPEPVLTKWNPHLILLCITCVHFTITLYYKKKKHHQHWWFHPRYVAGVLFLLWTTVAFLVGFYQHHIEDGLEMSTWAPCLALIASVGLFLYFQEVPSPLQAMTMHD
jgi:hypothetical protein